MIRVFLVLLLSFPCLASPLTDYLKTADDVLRRGMLYRQQFLATLNSAQQFGGVLKGASDYSRSTKILQGELEGLAPPSEAVNYHQALAALFKLQVQHAAEFEYRVTGLVGDEERLARLKKNGEAKFQEDEYKRHLADFWQFFTGISSVEGPTLDKAIELRQQLKPDFELEPATPKPQPRRRL